MWISVVYRIYRTMILLQLFHWKAMAFKGGDPIRTKIVIDNKIIEQVNSFNYLGNTV